MREIMKRSQVIQIILCMVEMFVQLNKTNERLKPPLESYQMLLHGHICVYLGAF